MNPILRYHFYDGLQVDHRSCPIIIGKTMSVFTGLLRNTNHQQEATIVLVYSGVELSHPGTFAHWYFPSE